MKKFNTLLISLLLAMLLSCHIYGQDQKLQAHLNITYMSKLMDKGGEYYGQQGGFLKTFDLDLWGTGFGAALSHRQATGGNYASTERIDSALYYGNSVFDDEFYKTNYQFTYVFHSFHYKPRIAGNYHEYVMSLSWDNLLPANVKLFYNLAYENPDSRGNIAQPASGFWHQIGINYGIKISGLPGTTDTNGQTQDMVCNLSADIAYRDGLGGDAVDHDWSHATFGASTAFNLTENLIFVPGLFFQKSMDTSVTDKDVTYVSLSMKYKF